MLSSPHLMLPDVRSDNIILIFDNRVQGLEKLRSSFAAEVLVHTGPAFDQLPPGIKIMLDAACLQHLQSCVHMTGNTDTGINIFIQLRRVDI